VAGGGAGSRGAADWGTGAAGAADWGTGAAGRGTGHRQFTESDLDAIRAGMELERRYDITPAALAFGLRVLTEPAVRAAVADLGRRTGHVPASPGRALDFEKERALRALGTSPRSSTSGATPVGHKRGERGPERAPRTRLD
jgi:MerR family transcriptional regulator, copper efflux regulator